MAMKKANGQSFSVLLPRKWCGCVHEFTKSWAQHEKKSLLILHMDNHKLVFLGILQLYCWYMCLNIRDGEDSWEYCEQPRKETEESLNKLIQNSHLRHILPDSNYPYFRHILWRPSSLEKSLMVWKIEGEERRGWPIARRRNSVIIVMSTALDNLKDQVRDRLSRRKFTYMVAMSWNDLMTHNQSIHAGCVLQIYGSWSLKKKRL